MRKRSVILPWIFGVLLVACTMPAPSKNVGETGEVPIPTTVVTATQPPIEMQTPATTPTIKPMPSLTPTQESKPTIFPTDTPVGGEGGVESDEPENVYPYAVQLGTPVGTINFVRPELGCNWMGVGGQVFGSDGKPVNGVIVEVEGGLAGQSILNLSLTGDETILGPGGYVIQLADQPVASQGALWLQLFDLEGNPLSDAITFDTDGGDLACEKNLTVINFSEISGKRKYEFRLPLIIKQE